jgi:hypothetical protein
MRESDPIKESDPSKMGIGENLIKGCPRDARVLEPSIGL